MTVEIAGERRDGDLPGRQGRLVLAYLALNHGRPVTREELVEAVWGEEAGRGHAQSLNVVLSKLRRALGQWVVEGVRTASVQLCADVEVDLRTLNGAVSEVRQALAAEAWADVPEAARMIIEHADRGLLVGLEAPWIDEARRELEELALEARAVLAEADLAIGGTAELADAERVARTLVERSPYRESGHVLLMRVLEAEGNVAEALRVYDRLRVLLREELGVVPSRRVQVILERLLRQEAQPAPTAVPEPDIDAAGAPPEAVPVRPPVTALPFFATRSRAAFVGRRTELEATAALLRACAVRRAPARPAGGRAGDRQDAARGAVRGGVPRRRRRWRSTAAATPRPSCPTSPSSRRCRRPPRSACRAAAARASRAARARARPRAARAGATPARPRRRRARRATSGRALPALRGRVAAARRRRRGRSPCCSCSTTCTGPTGRRC